MHQAESHTYPTFTVEYTYIMNLASEKATKSASRFAASKKEAGALSMIYKGRGWILSFFSLQQFHNWWFTHKRKHKNIVNFLVIMSPVMVLQDIAWWRPVAFQHQPPRANCIYKAYSANNIIILRIFHSPTPEATVAPCHGKILSILACSSVNTAALSAERPPNELWHLAHRDVGEVRLQLQIPAPGW